MRSTDLVKHGNRPEMLFKVTLNPDGLTYQKEISLVFPRYASADLPHYKEEYMEQVQNSVPDNCKWNFSIGE
ncbi:MAG: hypothetical protein R2741_02585 [Methanolobus sp.]